MIKSIGIRQGDAWTPHHGDYTGWRGSMPVMVYRRTKRSIIKPTHIGMRTSHYPNVFNGTITLKGIQSL